MEEIMASFVEYAKLIEDANKLDKCGLFCLGIAGLKEFHMTSKSFDEVVGILHPTVRYDYTWDDDYMRKSFEVKVNGVKYLAFGLEAHRDGVQK